jgi:3-oxoacyl-[acyl-carrier protein] reductase
MSELLLGKTAIVTGAAQGIGFEIVRELLENGAKVLINDLEPEMLDNACKQLLNWESQVLIHPGDAGNSEVIKQMVHSVVESFGKLDMVVANAGITIPGEFLSFEEDDLRSMFDLNLIGSFLLAQAAANKMIEQANGGRILFLSSVTGVQAIKGTEGYGMTKAALRMLAKTAGVELAPYGITVNCVAPGATETERTLQNPQYSSDWGQLIPTGRPATTRDIAKACLYFLGPHASQVTGQTLVVDGGWSVTGAQPEQI